MNRKERRMSANPYECPWSGYECTRPDQPLCDSCIIYGESKIKRNADLNAELEKGVKAVYGAYNWANSPSACHQRNVLK